MAILDTNVFIRFLTQDSPELSPRATALFGEIETDRRTVHVPEAVVAEIVFVLSSANLYDCSRDFIRDQLGHLMRLPGIEIPNKTALLDALDMYVDFPRLAFLDALCIAHAKRFDDATVITFDRGYRNIEGVTPVAP